MAQTILMKRGSQADVENLALEYGEIALAYNTDKTAVDIYAGTGSGIILLNAALSDEVKAAIATALASANNYTDEKIDDLVNGAPEAMDTLSELAEVIASNEDIMSALNAAIGNKVDKVEGKGLSTEDYTTEEKTKLAGVAANANNYVHPSTHEASVIAEDSTHRFVTDDEKSAWNSKLSSTSTIDGGTF